MARIRFSDRCIAVLVVAASILFFSAGSAAQDAKAGDIILPAIGSGSVDAYIEALKSDIQTHTRKIVEVNMQLTGKEAALFWPIYGHYAFYRAGLSTVKDLRDDLMDRLLGEAGTLQREGLAEVRRRLGPPGASGRAARAVLAVAREDG